MLCQYLLQNRSVLRALFNGAGRANARPYHEVAREGPTATRIPHCKTGRERLCLSLPAYYVTLVRLVPGRLLQPFEEGRIGWTIDLEQAKGALFGAEERVVNRHKRTGHFAFEFSDGRFTRPHQGALDRFKRRF